jgi:glycerol-3-phosphate dehydrogenase (NAD(P)+)
MSRKISIIGAGAWGTTLGQVAVDAGSEVLIWGRNPEIVAEINERSSNEKFLPGIKLPNQLRATGDITQAFESAEAIILAIPAQSLRENLESWRDFYPREKVSISTLKGIELSTQLRMSQVLMEVIGVGSNEIGFITGPNLAGELSLRQPAGAVGASENPLVAQLIAEIFTTPYFRVLTSEDLLGCELAAALKNIVAVAVGVVVGLGYGENTQAMIITRGLNEVTKLGVALGAQPLTFSGLAGMGDLVATCQSSLSRNRSFGEEIGRLGSSELASTSFSKTVEAVASAGAVVEMADMVGVEIPIIESVADLIAGRLTPLQALEKISAMSTGAELDFRESSI